MGDLDYGTFSIALRETVKESPGLLLPLRTNVPSVDLPELDFRAEEDPYSAAFSWMLAEMRKPLAITQRVLFQFALIRDRRRQSGMVSEIPPRDHRRSWAPESECPHGRTLPRRSIGHAAAALKAGRP